MDLPIVKIRIINLSKPVAYANEGTKQLFGVRPGSVLLNWNNLQPSIGNKQYL